MSALRRIVLPAVMLAFLFGFARMSLANTVAGTVAKTERVGPPLSVNIPYVTFQAAGPDGVYYDIPWIANYVSGVYRYAVSIAVLLSGVMFIIGGFYYLTAGGDKSRVEKGKQRITDALIGLALVMGAFVLLLTINPDLVNITSLGVKKIERISFESSLGSTTEDTESSSSEDAASTAPTGGGAEGCTAVPDPVGSGGSASRPSTRPPGPIPGAFVPAFTSCPFTLTQTGEAQRAEFYDRIRTGGRITGTNVRDRILQIAAAADACDVALGSCGRTAGTISALAGVGGGACLNPPTGNCNGTHGRPKRSISSAQRRHIYGVRCDMTPANQRARYCRSDCQTTSSNATALISAFFRAEAAAGRLPGWPDEWADDLRPGDYVVIYNGNRDLVGAHAVIFVGWASPGNMQVVQGSYGRPTSSGTICVKSSCGTRMKPLLYIWSPD